jgi:hypothetical protein
MTTWIMLSAGGLYWQLKIARFKPEDGNYQLDKATASPNHFAPEAGDKWNMLASRRIRLIHSTTGSALDTHIAVGERAEK